MLDILKNKNLINVLVIVTRYFGGILLGTGGLVKAYSDSCIIAIEKSKIIKAEIANEYLVELNYSEIAKLKYVCEKENIYIENGIFTQNAQVKIYTNEEKMKKLENQITFITIIEKNRNIIKNGKK